MKPTRSLGKIKIPLYVPSRRDLLALMTKIIPLSDHFGGPTP